MAQDFKMVGKIKEAHGLRGEFYVLIFSGEISWLSDLKNFQLRDSSGSQVVSMNAIKAKAFKKGFILSVEGVENRTQAEAYHGFTFWIPSTLLISRPGESIFLSEIENFRVLDLAGTELGVITGFSSNGAQDILLVKSTTADGEIPFVAPFIKDINFAEKFIVMDLPPGLFELDRMK